MGNYNMRSLSEDRQVTEVVFYVALLGVLYPHLLFPLVLLLRGFLWRRPVLKADIEPPVSVIIAARNEAVSIAAKIENTLALDYPPEKLNVVVASDGSEDGTDERVLRYADRGVRLLPLPRCGKAEALNSAVEVSSGEILVFTDANSVLSPDAIRALVRPFADPKVGGVAGNQCYLEEQGGRKGVDGGEILYWSFDRLLKQAETLAGNVISATGAIYAIRRSRFRTIPAGVTDDFFVSASVVAQGYRLVFEAAAVAFEPTAGSHRGEFARKVRIMTRGLRGILILRELLNPFRHGFYALQLLSHKVLRRLTVFPLLVLLVVSPVLWEAGAIYRLVTVGQAGLLGCAAARILLGGSRLSRARVFSVPFFFCAVHAAELVAFFNLLRGHRIERWEPTARGSTGRPTCHEE